MIHLFILSLLVGAVLGLRLRVWILIPTMGLAFIGIGAFCGARGDAPGIILAAVVLAGLGLQFGYLSGSATRFVVAAARAPAPREAATALGDDRPAFRS